ncbi:MAG: carboxylesterase/lipase family protein [Polyangiales bacterium]
MFFRWVAVVLAAFSIGGCSTIVETDAGVVQGFIADGVANFLGIPYAAPPVGENRFRAPQPLIPWEGVRMATSIPTPCRQRVPIIGKAGTEDCLKLNVHAPVGAQGLPVMVWIHGGGFVLGEAGQTDFKTLGDRIARRHGVVVVGVNYRLGALGFLAHPLLSGEDPNHRGSGNYGLLDQRAALQWVQRNIAAFGGDPNNVTIFGQSAGSMSACMHLASPLSAGLFHRAILQSGACMRPLAELSVGESQGQRLSHAIGCDESDDELACLRAANPDRVLDALPLPDFFIPTPDDEPNSWFPIKDEVFLTDQPRRHFESGQFNHVPIMMGFTEDEANLFTAYIENTLNGDGNVFTPNPPLTQKQYEDEVGVFFGRDPSLVQTVLQQYNTAPSGDEVSPGAAFSKLVTDTEFRCPTRWQMRVMAPFVTEYMYEFAYDHGAFSDPFTTVSGAFHYSELQYVFGSSFNLFTDGFDNVVERKLSDVMMSSWANFAKSGDPNGGVVPRWPTWTPDSDSYMRFDENSVASTGAASDACAFWEEIVADGKNYLFPAVTQ